MLLKFCLKEKSSFINFGLKNDEKPQILLEAQVENGKVNWTCRDNPKALDHFDQKLLPASCRE